MPGTSYIGGIISGLDMDSIMSKLLEVAQAPVDRLNQQQAALETKLTAWQTANTRLLALKTEAAALANPSTLGSYGVTSSDEQAVTASASDSALSGIYALTVTQLATAHQMASQGYADYDTTSVGAGTITIGAGSADPVVLDVNNLTLAQLRDAINNANAGVRAHIISDGSSAPYRLLLTSQDTGSANAMTVSVNLTGGAAPAFTEIQAARDAQIAIGEGENAITLSSSTNTMTDAIPGLTLYLHEADPTKQVVLTAARDTKAMADAINSFVTQYNNLVDFIAEQSAYDATSGKTGTLFGEYTLQEIQNDLRSIVSAPAAGLPGPYSLLSQIGLRVNADDKLELDSTALDAALSSNPDAVMQLFSRFGTSSDPRLSFIGATGDTKSSGAVGYAIEITQAATRSRVTAGVAQVSALAADETVTINGVAIELTAGMTQQQVLDAINAQTGVTGVTAVATGGDGTGAGSYLTLRRAGYGPSTITAISTASNAGGASSGIGAVQVTESAPGGESGGGTGALGQNVAGTIDGQAATGSGQMLTATAGDPKGLSVMVAADAPGSYGAMTFSQGVAGALDGCLAFLTDSDYGPVHTAQDAVNASIDDIKSEITRLQDTIAAQQERIRQQFQTMEEMLGQLQTQSQFLSQQFAQINANWRGASG